MTHVNGEHALRPIDSEELDPVFELKYGAPDRLGPGPALYRRFGYHNPDDFYEAIVARLVDERCAWADVGCGRMLFPGNAPLAERLAARCRRLVGIDPDATIEENPYVHEAVRVLIDEYQPTETFDLITLRMVAEHIAHPERLVATLAKATHSGSMVVVYTVNGRSPVPLVTRITPMSLRHPIKKLLWRTQEKDTFPTAYRMNTRRALRSLFADGGFEEVLFDYLDDCRTLSRFRPLLMLELLTRSVFRAVGLAYPENCLLGVYRRS